MLQNASKIILQYIKFIQFINISLCNIKILKSIQFKTYKKLFIGLICIYIIFNTALFYDFIYNNLIKFVFLFYTFILNNLKYLGIKTLFSFAQV